MLPSAAFATPGDAKVLIARGELAAANDLLDEQMRAGWASTESYFLIGLIAVQRQDYRRAIASFRAALVREPGSTRLRLELGRAFYLARDYRNAALQFERALAGKLPPGVQANARRFLEQIRREKRWTYEVSFGLAPDTNINAGSSADVTTLFGLPFELGSDAKKRSGVGVVTDGSMEFAPNLGQGFRWKSGLAGRRREYKGSRFDDTIVSGWTGPQWLGKNVEVSVAATTLWRWYGPRLYQRAAGARVEAIVYAGQRSAFLLGVSGQRFVYPTIRDQSGPVWSANAGIIRVLDPATSLSFEVNGARQEAHSHDLSNWSGLISASLTRDLRGGFTVTLAPTYAFADYDSPDALFGVTRRDRSKELRVTVLNRRAAIWHFTPTLTYTLIRRESSIDLFDSRQDRLELGLTSIF